jgi:very-short-patch-repair endonuclease
MPDGRLTLVLGCWWPPDLAELREPVAVSRLDAALSEFLDDQLHTILVPWPGGVAAPSEPEPEEVEPPDVLAGLPLEVRQQAAACESALERLFFARAWTSGLRLACQYPVLSYRLDLALAKVRVGAEIVGWLGPHPGRMARWEREQQLGAESWRVLYFAGREVHHNVDKCVAQIIEAAGERTKDE